MNTTSLPHGGAPPAAGAVSPVRPHPALTATLVTGELAATEVDVSPATLRKWVQLGHLEPAGRQGRRSTYRLEDVFAAERSVHGRPDHPRPLSIRPGHPGTANG